MAGVISGGGQWAYVIAAYALTALLTGAVPPSERCSGTTRAVGSIAVTSCSTSPHSAPGWET